MSKTLQGYYETLLERKFDELKKRSEYLSTTLDYVSQRIEKDGVNASINSCGECQSEATLIDDLCKEIGQIRQMLEMIKGYSHTKNLSN